MMRPLLQDPKVRAVDGHQAVVVDLAFLVPFKVNLQCREEGGEEGSRRVRAREYTRCRQLDAPDRKHWHRQQTMQRVGGTRWRVSPRSKIQ